MLRSVFSLVNAKAGGRCRRRCRGGPRVCAAREPGSLEGLFVAVPRLASAVDAHWVGWSLDVRLGEACGGRKVGREG